MIGCGIFSLRRFSYLKKLLDSLENASGTENIHFYLFQDGRINQSSGNLYAALPQHTRCIHYFKQAKLPFKTVVKRGKNIGVALNQYKGVNTVFENHEIGFFLENDIVVAPDYFPIMLKILDKYGGLVKAACRPSLVPEDEDIVERKTISGENWLTTKDVWEATRPLLKDFVSYISDIDYIERNSKEMTSKFGSATQDGVRARKIREAGYKVWETTKPKVRVIGGDGVHGASKRLLEVTDEDILCKIQI